MRVPRIYTSQALALGVAVDLEPEPSHHLIKVLRMGPGRAVKIFNGDGNEYAAKITAATKKAATVTIESCLYLPNESMLTTVLAIAVSKGDRFDWVIQKATELGVSTIQPLFTERSEVKLSGERLAKKIGAWGKIIIAACEQCQRNKLPLLNPAMGLEAFVGNCDTQAKFVLHHHSDGELDAAAKPASACFLIGPEGGLSDSEIAAAKQHGFKGLRFGERVLRTETAPVVALSLAQFLWGDFR